MTENKTQNNSESQIFAPLDNISQLNKLAIKLQNLPPHLPRLASFHGFSGYGKTFAADYIVRLHKAAKVEMGMSWTTKVLLEKILAELGANPKKRTIASATDEIIQLLVIEQRLLIIDEADFLAKNNMFEIIREISDKSQTPVILIGEENLPAVFSISERFHNRFLDFVPAQPITRDDVSALAKMFSRDVEITPQLLDWVHERSAGHVRRAVVNISNIHSAAKNLGIKIIGFDDKGKPPVELWAATNPPRRKMGQ